MSDFNAKCKLTALPIGSGAATQTFASGGELSCAATAIVLSVLPIHKISALCRTFTAISVVNWSSIFRRKLENVMSYSRVL